MACGMGATDNRDARDFLPDEQPGVTVKAPAVAAPRPGPTRPAGLRRLASRPVVVHLTLLVAYIAAGVAVSWPRASYLVDGRLPAFHRDTSAYVWDFWWVARQVEHLSSPWFTRSLAAPVGAQLGYHALMPLPGLVLTPVTAAFGAAASYNLLSAITPGLLCYAMYRLARLWIPSQTGAIAAGAFFGLSSLLVYQSWYLLNLAVGPLFIPLALEAAVRLRRDPSRGRAVILGVVIAAALLTDQESAILVIIAVALALLPWLAARPAWAKARQAALAVVVAVVVASPQLVAMAQQAAAGGATSPPGPLAVDDAQSGIRLPGMFAPSPRLASFGLRSLASLYYDRPTIDTIGTFGLVLSVLAVAGLVISWRRRNAWLLALLWAGCALLAVGSVLRVGNHVFVPLATSVHGVRLSALLPFTWFTRIPGLDGFREASRLTLLGIVPAALLAGSAVDWLRHHAKLALVPVLALGVLEAGWSGGPGFGTMPAALPALDRPIAADHSGSIVVDVPFGIKGGLPDKNGGAQFSPEAQVLATQDGHPRAVAYLARVPAATLAGIRAEPFYAGLLTVQGETQQLAAAPLTAAQLQAARLNARAMDVGWVLVWRQSPAVLSYLRGTGFRFSYQADGVRVYRPG
jgi:4-amino-4-deoxy-L-arabinose transferase-like glycosyltransferase